MPVFGRIQLWPKAVRALCWRAQLFRRDRREAPSVRNFRRWELGLGSDRQAVAAPRHRGQQLWRQATLFYGDAKTDALDEALQLFRVLQLAAADQAARGDTFLGGKGEGDAAVGTFDAEVDAVLLLEGVGQYLKGTFHESVLPVVGRASGLTGGPPEKFAVMLPQRGCAMTAQDQWRSACRLYARNPLRRGEPTNETGLGRAPA